LVLACPDFLTLLEVDERVEVPVLPGDVVDGLMSDSDPKSQMTATARMASFLIKMIRASLRN
jgi:hypothetical protein